MTPDLVPDLVDVVSTTEEAGRLPHPPLVVLESLVPLLDDAGLGEGDLQVRRIGGGHSNVTFELERLGWAGVLRRPPRPPYQEKAHDMLREVRVQRALAGTDVPVPRIDLVERTGEVLGVPFYVMERLEGVVLTDRVPDELDVGSAAPARLGELTVDTLAALHEVDPHGVGLTNFGRPDGFAERQLATFGALWASHRTRDLDDIEVAERWLRQNVPAPSGPASVIHGDYRLANLLWSELRSPRLGALLDWELATVGEPLSDLGYLLSTYPQSAAERGTLLDEASVAVQAGLPDRAGIVARYEELTDRDTSSIPWWVALAFWRTAVGLESFYRRGLAGTTDDPFILQLREGVPELARQAVAAIEGEW